MEKIFREWLSAARGRMDESERGRRWFRRFIKAHKVNQESGSVGVETSEERRTVS